MDFCVQKLTRMSQTKSWIENDKQPVLWNITFNFYSVFYITRVIQNHHGYGSGITEHQVG